MRGLGPGARGWGARVREGGAVVGWWFGGSGCKFTEQIYLGWVEFRVVRVVRVPWPNTRTTRTNFGYRGLEPGLEFGFFELDFFGFGLGFFGLEFRVSGFLPSHYPQAPTSPGFCGGRSHAKNTLSPCGPDARSCGAPSREHAGLYTLVDESLFTFRSNRGWIG